jgi:LuxR family maltose regulon positive regulatory protein
MPGAQVFPWLSASASIRMIALAVDPGDRAAAERAAAQVRLVLARMPSVGVLGDWYTLVAAELDRRSGADGAGPISRLTTAEYRVLGLLPTHLTLHEIAGELSLSRNTVKTQVAAIYRKLAATNRAAAVRAGRDLGMLE